MDGAEQYRALSSETLPPRLVSIPAVAARVGEDASAWKVREVGDGNLNLVFIVEGPAGDVIVKQALPYVRLVGESWPLPLNRSFFEFHALTRQAWRDPGSVPEVFHFDEAQALIVMERLSPHVILRRKLIAGERVEDLGARLGQFCARTAFRGSDLALPAATRKADAALFLGNVDLMKITEDLVFTDPYFDAEMNSHTPGLEPIVAELRADDALKAEAQHLLRRYATAAETMMHGDLHTGSVMCTDRETRVIDPEFASYGPMGFDLGMLVANYLMAFLSQPAHRSKEECWPFQLWLLNVIGETFTAFEAEFRRLWAEERAGMLYPRALFEDQGRPSAPALEGVLAEIRRDALGFCGIEMHRRSLSLAHNADFEEIGDLRLRAKLEARSLVLGRELVMRRSQYATTEHLMSAARRRNAMDLS